jgi:Nucleoside 2-deoxyribosyltransferase like
VGEIRLVMAREHIPAGPSVFLAGPTPAQGSDTPSWRPAAAQALSAAWHGRVPLLVLSPESRGGVRAERYVDQVRWEMRARSVATAVMFWIPRCMVTLPGMTTNVEFGVDVARCRRMVLGAPPDCPNPERNRYLIALAEMEGVPVRETLADTIAEAIKIITGAD